MIQITETQVVEPFGEFFRMDPLRRDDGTYPVTIVVGTRGSGSLHPRQLMLPHQLYTHNVEEMLASTGDREVYVHPIYDEGFRDNWHEVVLPEELRESLKERRKTLSRTQILPGDYVEHVEKDLDARRVLSIGKDWLTLDILGTETERLPQANYRIVRHGEMLR